MTHLVLKTVSGPLPTSTFDFMEDGIRIGTLQIRHRPSHSDDLPPEMGSHVYYEIEPVYRGKGYGNEILRQGLDEAKKIGLKEIFITCFEDNAPSQKVIKKNGGVFENSAVTIEGRKMLRYRIAV